MTLTRRLWMAPTWTFRPGSTARTRIVRLALGPPPRRLRSSARPDLGRREACPLSPVAWRPVVVGSIGAGQSLAVLCGDGQQCLWPIGAGRWWPPPRIVPPGLVCAVGRDQVWRVPAVSRGPGCCGGPDRRSGDHGGHPGRARWGWWHRFRLGGDLRWRSARSPWVPCGRRWGGVVGAGCPERAPQTAGIGFDGPPGGYRLAGG